MAAGSSLVVAKTTAACGGRVGTQWIRRERAGSRTARHRHPPTCDGHPNPRGGSFWSLNVGCASGQLRTAVGVSAVTVSRRTAWRGPRKTPTPTSLTGRGGGAGRGGVTPTKALPETLFTIGTVAVLPLYCMMIGAPHAAVSKRVMSSAVPFAVMGGVYAVAACLIVQSVAAHELMASFVAATVAGGGSLGASFAALATHTLTLVSG